MSAHEKSSLDFGLGGLWWAARSSGVPMIDYTKLPERLRGGAKRWIDGGIQPGSFLMAIICNNLIETVMRTDDDNRADLHQILRWFCNEAPAPCWGNVARAQKWAECFGKTINLEWPA